MRRLEPAFAAVLAACLVLAPAAASAQEVHLTMSATPGEVAVGGTVDLQIRADVTNGAVERVEPPELSGFDVVSRSIANPMQFRFGFGSSTQVVQSTTMHTFTLRASRAGRFELRPAQVWVNGRVFRSNPVTIVVRDGGGMSPPNPGYGQDDPQPQQDPTPPAGQLDGATFDPQAFLR